MKRLISSIFLTSCLWAIANLSNSPHSRQAAARVTTPVNLLHAFSGQKMRGSIIHLAHLREENEQGREVHSQGAR